MLSNPALFLMLFSFGLVAIPKVPTGATHEAEGSVNDLEADLAWLAFAEPKKSAYRFGHYVENRGKSAVRFRWKDSEDEDILRGFPAPGETNHSDGEISPCSAAGKNKGDLNYNKQGKKEAVYCLCTHDQKMGQGEFPMRANTAISLTVQREESKFELLELNAESVVEKKGNTYIYIYTISVRGKTIAASVKDLRMDWRAADSFPLANTILKNNKEQKLDNEQYMRFAEKGIAKYSVPFEMKGGSGGTFEHEPETTVARHVRQGSLAIRNQEGEIIGAAYAPAFAPPTIIGVVQGNSGEGKATIKIAGRAKSVEVDLNQKGIVLEDSVGKNTKSGMFTKGSRVLLEEGKDGKVARIRKRES